MSGARIRRITRDQIHLRAAPPLDYLFFDSPTTGSSATTSSTLNDEDITTVDVFLLGPAATAYENGVFRISLKLGSTYPNEPPTACFKTKIFHPNINMTNGDVCVDTLKNGWTSKLTLIDVLSTIRCLLIHPNPSSALNSDAAMLADTDYKAFEKQAKLFTKIYASVPFDMKLAVKDAREKRSAIDGVVKKNTPVRRSQKAERSASATTSARNAPSSEEEKKTPAAAPNEKLSAERENEGEKSNDSGKENTTSGHANNVTVATTSTPKNSVSNKRSFDAVAATTAPTRVPAKRSSPRDTNDDDASAPLQKKILRSDARKKPLQLSRENSGGSVTSSKGRSTSMGSKPGAPRKGLRRL